MPGARGAIIAVVEPGGPAASAALRPGDILMAIGNAKESSSRAFMRSIVQIPIGAPALLSVWRDGKEYTASATVAEWPKIAPEGGAMTSHGRRDERAGAASRRAARALTDAARKQYGLDEKLTGALVASVEQYCEARDLGIVPGDVITAVLGAPPVTAPEDVQHAMQKAHEERRPSLALLVQGKSGVRWVSLSISLTGS